MPELGVVLLGPSDVTSALTEELAAPEDGGATAVTAADAGELRASAAVIGVASQPWPAFARDHEEAGQAVAPAPYVAVQSWHRHPAYLDRLVAALEEARQASPDGDVHVLFTAPGPTSQPDPGEVVFLRETAEAVSALAGVTRRSIAWSSGVLGPSTAAALTALAEAHGRTAVLRCSLDPLAARDQVAGEAEAVGLSLTEASLDRGDLAAILRAVVATVIDHERLAGDPA